MVEHTFVRRGSVGSNPTIFEGKRGVVREGRGIKG